MSDIFDALINGNADPASLAAGLRRQQGRAEIASLSGIPQLQQLGASQREEAGKSVQDYATLRDRTQNQVLQRALQAQNAQDRQDYQASALAQAATLAKQHDETMRAIGMGHDKARATGSFQQLTPEENDALFAPGGAVDRRLLNPDKINGRNAKILANGFLTNPNQDLNSLAQEGALMRNVPFVSKQLTLEQIPTVLSSVVDAGKALNFSDNRLLGSMQALKDKYSNDPKYTKYMALRNDSLLAIAGAMRGQGMSDFATKLEDEAQHPTQSPKALEGWLTGQMTALGPKLKLAEHYLHRPGADQPTPTPPGSPTSISSQEEYDALPAGASYSFNGQTGTKR